MNYFQIGISAVIEMSKAKQTKNKKESLGTLN